MRCGAKEKEKETVVDVDFTVVNYVNKHGR